MTIDRVNFAPLPDGGDNVTAALVKLDENCQELSDAIGGTSGGVTTLAERVDAIETVVDGLGNASTKDVGTAAGTVAAGNDSRFFAGTRGLKNKLMNSAAVINNRRFAGGALSTGVYGFDRWKAAQSGTSWTCVAGLWTLTGGLLQGIAKDPANPLDGKTVTVSVEAPSGPVTVQLSGTGGSVSGVIPAGAGRQSTTLVMPTTTGASNSVVLSVTGTQTFRNPQLEIGSVATPYEERDSIIEDILCAAFCPAIKASSANSIAGTGQCYNTTSAAVLVLFPIKPRVPPTSAVISGSGHFSVAQSTTANVAATNVTFSSASMSGAQLLATGASGLVAGNATQFAITNAAGWIYFEGCDF